MRLENSNNINDLRALARKKLPAAIFQFLEGGADDETTLRQNTGAFSKYALIPNYLVDVSDIDLSTSLTQ